MTMAENEEVLEGAEIPLIEGDAPEGEQASEQSAEDRALTMGWTPREQFKGDPAKWVDAETFVRRGEEFLPFVKANNKRLERELEKANTKMAALEKAVSQSVAHISRAEKRAYDQARKDLEAELGRATEAGDIDGVMAAAKEMADLEKEVVAPKADDTADIDGFKTANPWFQVDEDMTAYAMGLRFPADTSVAEQFRLIGEKVRKAFPQKFQNPARQKPAAVADGGGPVRKAGKSYADLPPEAKRMCDEFVRDIPGFTREKFTKDYDFG